MNQNSHQCIYQYGTIGTFSKHDRNTQRTMLKFTESRSRNCCVQATDGIKYYT